MSKSRRAVAETKLSESESESDFSEEEIAEKPKKKVVPKKKTAPKKASASGKVAAPPVTEKKTRKPAAKKIATPAPEEVEEEEAPVVEKKEKKASAPRKGRKAPVPKEGQRSFQISIDSVEPPIDASLLKEHDDIVHGTTPLQAGRKTFTRLLRKYKDTGVTAYKFVIVETTGTKKASFSYEGKRVEREVPRVIKKGDSEYSINHDFVVKATKKPKAEGSE